MIKLYWEKLITIVQNFNTKSEYIYLGGKAIKSGKKLPSRFKAAGWIYSFIFSLFAILFTKVFLPIAISKFDFISILMLFVLIGCILFLILITINIIREWNNIWRLDVIMQLIQRAVRQFVLAELIVILLFLFNLATIYMDSLLNFYVNVVLFLILYLAANSFFDDYEFLFWHVNRDFLNILKSELNAFLAGIIFIGFALVIPLFFGYHLKKESWIISHPPETFKLVRNTLIYAAVLTLFFGLIYFIFHILFQLE